MLRSWWNRNPTDILLDEDKYDEDDEGDNWDYDEDGFLILPELDFTWGQPKKRRLVREVVTNRYSTSLKLEYSNCAKQSGQGCFLRTARLLFRGKTWASARNGS